jgi:SPP1 gp7 family putative phage head morphogenesis protein
MYDYTDKAIKYLDRRYIRMFGKVRALASFDEVHVMSSVKSLYGELERLTREIFLRIARRAYDLTDGPGSIDAEWVDELLEGYDPVTKYVFSHEVERKAARFAEALVASHHAPTEVKTALRLWSRMVHEYAVRVTREAAKKSLCDCGIEYWRWHTLDDRACRTCRERNGKIYRVSDYPDPPHIGCRCYPEAVRK